MTNITLEEFKLKISNEYYKTYRHIQYINGYSIWKGIHIAEHTEDESLIPKINYVSIYIDYEINSKARYFVCMYDKHFRYFKFENMNKAIDAVNWLHETNKIQPIHDIELLDGDDSKLGQLYIFENRPMF